ncbi:MAG: 23S rRNA (adenine(2503)-C(2))-methyltransferase RlmN [Planctomycetota bacterium]|nr:MAG: 23S rRNA (adenine(2503)-C(2))-methyltransferase RlmN [Planctomycetota bacterium]
MLLPSSAQASRTSVSQSTLQTQSGLPVIEHQAPPRPAIMDLDLDQLTTWLASVGQPRFRAGQIRRWLVQRRIESFAQMTDLPIELRTHLATEFRFSPFEVVKHQISQDETEKLLLRLQDGELVECVLMRDPDRRTVCISTQVGCAMGCVFCASGLLGVKRNLTPTEIIEQVLVLHRMMKDDERITNVVVMGIGEPLANYQGLMDSLTFLTAKDGFGLGARRITVSTVGLPDKIRELAQSGQQYNLAVSLHAPNDTLRTEIVPVNKNIGIQEILLAADDYFEMTGRRISYEYVLMSGINDRPQHAEELAALLRGRNAHVNLIPMNGVSELVMTAPRAPDTQQFLEILEHRGITATVRKRKGADIDAACGQLRLNRETALGG